MMRVKTLEELEFWINHAEVGDDVTYHTGLTVMESDGPEILVNPHTRDTTRVPLAQRMWELAVRGGVFLYRVRGGQGRWREYNFCARRLSSKAGRVLRPRDREVMVCR